MSIPKCGTHMLVKCIEMITQNKKIRGLPWVPKTGVDNSYIDTVNKIIDDNKKSCFFRGHLVYDYELEKLLKLKKCKCFFIYRDPRGQVASWIKYVNEKDCSSDYLSKQILMLINGSTTFALGTKFNGSIIGLYEAYMPWASCKDVFTLRFEDLVGTKGGGDSKKQYALIKNMAEYIEIKLSSTEINKICDQLFGGTKTFSDGQIDGWRKYFTQEHKLAFKQKAGQLLIDLGYEKDLNW